MCQSKKETTLCKNDELEIEDQILLDDETEEEYI
jgi:hypothetical protein